jgi:hypothetical protein
LKYKKISNKGKWEIKSKKGMDNYELFLKIAGKEGDNQVLESFKKPIGRYK